MIFFHHKLLSNFHNHFSNKLLNQKMIDVIITILSSPIFSIFIFIEMNKSYDLRFSTFYSFFNQM